jgi:hypothetical protein
MYIAFQCAGEELYWKSGGKREPLVLTLEKEKATRITLGVFPKNWWYRMNDKVQDLDFQIV